MAWLEIHQSIRDHRKVLQAADELDISPSHMVGLLTLLWLWAVDNAENGDLSHVSPGIISRAAQWEGDTQSFETALKNAHLIDADMHLHDWSDYAGRLIEQREAKREKDRDRQRERRQMRKENGSHTLVEEPPVCRQRVADDSPVVQYRKAHNTKEQIIPPIPPEGGDAEAAVLDQNASAQTPFDVFWAAYPKKVGKEAARKAWNKVKPDKALREKIAASIETARASPQWRKNGGQYIPNPATWLNQGRWDDELNLSKSEGGEETGTNHGDTRKDGKDWGLKAITLD